MFKITPNPPVSIAPGIIDPQAADRALAHYNLLEGRASKRSGATAARRQVPAAQNREEALVNASSILESAAATAYENADNLTGANRKVGMGVVHMIELALGLVDSVIEEIPTGVTS
jgi:hypothetical protein